MQATEITRAQAMRRILSFTKGWRVSYALSVFMYSSQSYCSSMLMSLLLGGLTAATLAGTAKAVWQTAAVLTGALAGYFVILSVSVHLYCMCNIKLEKLLKKAMFRSFVQASLEESTQAGRGIAAINTEADAAIQCIFDSLCGLLMSLTSIFLSGITIFALDWRLGLVSVLGGLLALGGQAFFAGPLRRIASQRLDANALSTRSLSGMLDGGLMIRAYDLQSEAMEGFDEQNRKLLRLNRKQAILSMLQSMITNVQGWVILAGVLGFGAYLVATGRLEFPILIMAPTLCSAMGFGLSSLGAAWAGMQAPLEAAQRVSIMLDQSERITAVDRARKQVKWDGNAQLTMQGLDFIYSGADRETLKDITLTIRPGSMVALVGESGSGKSTLLRLLTGLYERGEQPVHLGNLTLGLAPMAQWRQHFAMVDQSCKLFDMTVAENIALGRNGTTQDEIEQAARQAGAYDFIAALPNGFDTPCGEKGAALSGGQRQRIAIARALVRRAPVLALDEATAALDAQSEQALLETVETLRRQHTILMVTHSLRQVVGADTIVVLRDGHVIETGQHEALLEHGGEYARLWRKEEKSA